MAYKSIHNIIVASTYSKVDTMFQSKSLPRTCLQVFVEDLAAVNKLSKSINQLIS